MAVLKTFSIDGKSFDSLPVLEFKVHYENLDGEGTDRMMGQGWPMIRFPEGTIINASMRVGLTHSSKESEFTDLIKELKSFGKVDFKSVSFHTPLGVIAQPMYGASFEIDAVRFEEDGTTYWGSIPVEFIAKEAYK